MSDGGAGGTGRKRSLGEWLVYLLPVLTAAGAGLWAVVTWLYPHGPERKPEATPAAATASATAAAPTKSSAAVSATGGSVAIGGPVSGSTIVNGGAEHEPAKR